MNKRATIEVKAIHALEAIDFDQDVWHLLQDDALRDFIDTGFSLLRYYQETGDTTVDGEVVGRYVDCCVTLSAVVMNTTLPAAVRQRADEVCTCLEDLMTGITREVERNLHRR